MSMDRSAEILNYLSAMSRDIGEFRQETKTRLLGLESRMAGVENRIGGLENRMEKLENRVEELGNRVEELGNRMDGLEMRMERLETEVRAGFEGVHKDIRHLTRKIEILNSTSLELQAGQRDLEARVEALEKKQT